MEVAGEAGQVYAAYKPLLFSLAYRMLGSVMDAEDAVQEAFLYMNEKNPQGIMHPKAYLCKMVTNRCIDKLRSAAREVYVGPWLPEPLITAGEDQGETPELLYAHKESLSTAYLLLLQQLSWVERAVFLLREVLQYEYDEIAEIVGKSSVNCRQIFRRAKSSISTFTSPDQSETEERHLPPKLPTNEQANAVVEQFVQALASGNMTKLLSIVKADAVLYSDGGGKVNAAIRPIEGWDRIAKFLIGVLSKAPAGYSYTLMTVNGQLGIVSYQDGQPNNVMTFHIADNRIAAFYLVINPDKLRHIAGVDQ